jgi:hypothetical protein
MMHKYHGTCEPAARSLMAHRCRKESDFCPKCVSLGRCLHHPIIAALFTPILRRVLVSCCSSVPLSSPISDNRNSILPLCNNIHPFPGSLLARSHTSYPELPPSPLSYKGIAAVRCATPFRYATPTNAPTNSTSIPSGSDQHAVCTPSLLHFPPEARSLQHYSLHPHHANHPPTHLRRLSSSQALRLHQRRCAPRPTTTTATPARLNRSVPCLLQRIAQHRHQPPALSALATYGLRSPQNLSLLPDFPQLWTLVLIRIRQLLSSPQHHPPNTLIPCRRSPIPLLVPSTRPSPNSTRNRRSP